MEFTGLAKGTLNDGNVSLYPIFRPFPTYLLPSLLLSMCRELQREKIWSRIHLVPILIAEADRDAYRRERAALTREKEIMKNVEGWEVESSFLFILMIY